MVWAGDAKPDYFATVKENWKNWFYAKASDGMDFQSWVKTMNVPAETVPRLAAMLDEASPALKAFIKPTNDNGKRGFTLDELIAIARRPA